MSAVSLPEALAEVLARGDVWRGDMLPGLAEEAIASGYAALDKELPGGGWPRGGLTEILGDCHGQGEISLLLPALAKLSADGGWLAMVDPPCLPHAPAWQAAGLALERLLVVRAGRDAAWCCEQLLACGGFAAVMAWSGSGIDARVLRRFQVALEGRPTLACLWRPAAASALPSPAALRLGLTASARGNLSVAILKRRGRPATRPIELSIFRPGRSPRALAGSVLPLAAARGAAVTIDA